MSTFSTHSTRSTHRGLVLAGGGAAGNAWALGVVAGLSDAGVDVTAADLIVGTSSGSTVAAQITCGTPAGDLYAAVIAEPAVPPGAVAEPGARRPLLSGPSYLHGRTPSSLPRTTRPTCAGGWAQPRSRWTPPTARPSGAGARWSRPACRARTGRSNAC